MASKVDELKSKFKSFVQKQQNKTMKVPSMGFTDYSHWPAAGGSGEPAPSSSVLLCSSPQRQPHPEGSSNSSDPPAKESSRVPDQEILESIEDIYFHPEPNVDLYELKKLNDAHPECLLASDQVEQVMHHLKTQHKVVSKKVMQMILEQRGHCNEEFQRIGETGHLLEESLWLCRKSRSYLSFAKKQLTTSNLEILATYKRRQVLQDLLSTLNKIKEIKASEEQLQHMLADGQDLPGAITLLLSCRQMAGQMGQYQCIASLSQKLQDTQMMTEVQLDKLLYDMVTEFDAKKYSHLQDAFKLLDKSQISVDQLHIDFISQIHSTAFHVLLPDEDEGDSLSTTTTAEDLHNKQKPLFEQLCKEVPVDKYIVRLIELSKCFWRILSCHHQISTWHQNFHIHEASAEDYIRNKLRSGQTRVWSDMQNKVCTYLESPAIHRLKFEQFIQVLSVVRRLVKVGQEFCGDASQKLLETVRRQSEEYFQRYHSTCLDEIGLFLDFEAWECIDGFDGFGQLQEFRSVKKAMRRHWNGGGGNNSATEGDSKAVVKSLATIKVNNINNNQTQQSGKQMQVENSNSSVHSQDGASSIYVFCGYFERYSDKSSPFDGGFDETMLQEDILAGIADETSCYFSDDEEEADEDNAVSSPMKGKGKSAGDGMATRTHLLANNTMLTVLRMIGKYLQMCRLMHVIAPQIVKSLTELIDFYIYVVHELFAKDLPFSSENIYQPTVLASLQRVFEDIIPKITHWPTSRAMVDGDLNSAESLFACRKRVVAVEGGVCLLEQMDRLKGYIASLLGGDKDWLEYYCSTTRRLVEDLRKPVYLCIAARFVDIPVVLQGMAKVKWDLNHVTVQYSPYVDTVNRIVQTFAMRLGELWKDVGGLSDVVREQLWDNVAHVVTHVLVEGYSLAKNCSTGGRALMQIDFTHILSFMELLSGYRFGGHQVYVDQYVKAYYLPKDGALRDWLQEQVARNEYSQKQLTGLVMCTCSSDKKIRQKLLGILNSGAEGSGGGGSPAKKLLDG